MAVVCPSCGVENRDKARFCLGCAASLDRPGEETSDAPAARSFRKRRATRSARASEGEGAPGGGGALKAGALVALVLIAALVWWSLGHQPGTLVARPPQPLPPATAATQPAPIEAVPVAAPTVPVSSETAVPPPSPAALSAAERLRESVEGLAQRDRVHQLELEQQRAKLVKELHRAEEARRRAEAPAFPRPVAAESASPAPAAAAPAAAAAPPSAPAAAAATAPGATVDQICAGSGNFLARDFCRLRECGKTSFASDPVCVRFRQMDEARRQQSN
jgi:hypothetical protein